ESRHRRPAGAGHPPRQRCRRRQQGRAGQASGKGKGREGRGGQSDQGSHGQRRPAFGGAADPENAIGRSAALRKTVFHCPTHGCEQFSAPRMRGAFYWLIAPLSIVILRAMRLWMMTMASVCWIASVATAAPATAPSTIAPSSPAAAPSDHPPFDHSTPKAALKAFAQVLDAGNRAGVIELLAVETDQDRKLAAATADLAQASAVLRASAIKAFGESKSRALGVDQGASAAAAARIDAAAETITGDTAVVRPADNDGPPMSLVKRSGVWLIPVGQLSKDVDPADIDRNL